MKLLSVSLLCFVLAVACALLGFAWPSWDDMMAAIKGAGIWRIGFVIFTTLFLITLVAGLLIEP